MFALDGHVLANGRTLERVPLLAHGHMLNFPPACWCTPAFERVPCLLMDPLESTSKNMKRFQSSINLAHLVHTLDFEERTVWTLGRSCWSCYRVQENLLRTRCLSTGRFRFPRRVLCMEKIRVPLFSGHGHPDRGGLGSRSLGRGCHLYKESCKRPRRGSQGIAQQPVTTGPHCTTHNTWAEPAGFSVNSPLHFHWFSTIVPLDRIRSSLGRTDLGKKIGRGTFLKLQCLYVHRKSQLFISVYVDDIKMVGNEEKWTHVDNSAKGQRSGGSSSPLMNKLCLGCTQRETWDGHDHVLVQAKAYFVRRMTAEVTNEKQNKRNPLSRSTRGVTTWRDMPNSALKDALNMRA